MNRRLNSTIVALFLAITCHVAVGGEDATKVKKIVDDAKDSIIQVEIVWEIKVKYKGQEQSRETKVVRNGITINENGLTVLSSMSVTPQAGKNRQGVSVQANPQSVKFILDDAKELDAEIVLKDKDLDIIYVKPTEAGDKAFPFLKLERDAKVEVLDSIVTFSRLGSSEDRSIMYYQETVNGIIKTPRKYYVSNGHGLGMPAFTMDGKCFGLFLARKGSNGFRILPAADILESAAQLDGE